MFEFRCPYCEGRNLADEENVGFYAVCPHCQKEVVISREERRNVKKEQSVSSIVEVEKEEAGLKVALITVGLSVAQFALFYYFVLGYVSPDSAFYRLVAVGWVPYVVMGLFFVSMSMVMIKVKDLHHHRGNIGEIYLSREDSLTDDHELRELRLRIAKRAVELHDTMLGGRVVASLERFQHTHSLREAEEVLKDEADRAFSSAESSYTLLRVIVWATPIMGFIGTVMGVSQSVGGLSNVLGGDVEDISQITGALTNVTKELAFSFDTTLIALVATVIIMVSMTLIEQAEFGLLDRVEEISHRQVLPNLPVQVKPLRTASEQDDPD